MKLRSRRPGPRQHPARLLEMAGGDSPVDHIPIRGRCQFVGKPAVDKTPMRRGLEFVGDFTQQLMSEPVWAALGHRASRMPCSHNDSSERRCRLRRGRAVIAEGGGRRRVRSQPRPTRWDDVLVRAQSGRQQVVEDVGDSSEGTGRRPLFRAGRERLARRRQRALRCTAGSRHSERSTSDDPRG